jgi:hypothetical protein
MAGILAWPLLRQAPLRAGADIPVSLGIACGVDPCGVEPRLVWSWSITVYQLPGRLVPPPPGRRLSRPESPALSRESRQAVLGLGRCGEIEVTGEPMSVDTGCERSVGI